MEAYEKGRLSYSDDLELSDNPYPANSKEHAEWEKGFKYAKRNDPLENSDE